MSAIQGLLSASSLMHYAAQDYVRKHGGSQQAQKLATISREDPAKHGGKAGDSVTVYRGTGLRRMSFSWKKEPNKAPQLVAKIAMLAGKLNRAEREVCQGPGARRRAIAAYTSEINRAKKELACARAAQPTNIVIVES